MINPLHLYRAGNGFGGDMLAYSIMMNGSKVEVYWGYESC
jgi:hypothetical protein